MFRPLGGGVPCDELIRAMLYHIRVDESDSAIHCACRLAQKDNARAVWKELILFTYSHVGLLNLSFPRLIFRQYYDWFMNGGQTTPDSMPALVHYVTAIKLCAKTPKNRISSACGNAYLLGATGELLPEDWSVQLCTTYYVNMCLRPFLSTKKHAVAQSCRIFGRAVIEKREDIACRHLDLLLGFERGFLAWDVLFSVVCHTAKLRKYLDTVGESLVHWLVLTETIDEETDLFVSMDNMHHNWFLRPPRKKRLSIGQDLDDCLDNMVVGAQFVPMHDERAKCAAHRCYNMLSERFHGIKISHAHHVRSRPLLFQMVLMLTRTTQFSVMEFNVHQMYASVEQQYSRLAKLFSTPVRSIPNDAIDVFTSRGRDVLRRGLVHLNRQENHYTNGTHIYEWFSKNIAKGYAAEESVFGAHTEADLFMRKAKAYALGLEGHQNT